MSFLTDDRGQAIQIGAIILFGAMVISFISYQVYVVPDQNRQVEFNHFKDTQDDMEDVRNSVIRAGQMSSEVPAGVDLGTTYPARLVATQPPGAFGSLRTSTIGASDNQYALTGVGENMTDICGLDSPNTRSAIYNPTYTYFQSVENITYENTVLYTNGQRTGRSFQTDQQIVEGDLIQVYPLVGAYDDSGMDRSTITFRGGVTGTNTSVPGPFTFTVPTRLSADQWRDLLENQSQVQSVSANATHEAVDIEFAGNENYEIRCSPAGAGRAPNNSPSVVGDRDSINPNFGDDVVLENVTAGNNSNGLDKNEVILQLRNTNQQEYQNITQIRFPFYSASAQSQDGDPAPNSLSVDNTLVERVGRLTSVDIAFAPGETRNITFSFWCGADGSDSYNVENNDFFVLTAFFGADKDRTYFAATDNGGSGTNRRCDDSGDFSGGGGGNSQLAYNSDATASVPSYLSNKEALVTFTVTNNHGQAATVTGFSLNSTSLTGGGGGQITEDQSGDFHEVWIDQNQDGDTADTDDGYVENSSANPLTEGSFTDLSSNGEEAVIDSGETAEIRLYHFEKNNPVDMTGEDITITIHYTVDGTQYTKEIQITNIG